WSDNVSLWSHTLDVTKDNSVAHDNLGGALLDRGDVAAAMPHFQQAALIDPSDPIANSNLAAYELQQGDVQQAIEKFQTILRSNNDPRLRASIFSNLGSAHARLHQYEAAKVSYQSALELDPMRLQAVIGLGLVAQKSGDLPTAIK